MKRCMILFLISVFCFLGVCSQKVNAEGETEETKSSEKATVSVVMNSIVSLGDTKYINLTIINNTPDYCIIGKKDSPAKLLVSSSKATNSFSLPNWEVGTGAKDYRVKISIKGKIESMSINNICFYADYNPEALNPVCSQVMSLEVNMDVALPIPVYFIVFLAILSLFVVVLTIILIIKYIRSSNVVGLLKLMTNMTIVVMAFLLTLGVLKFSFSTSSAKLKSYIGKIWPIFIIDLIWMIVSIVFTIKLGQKYANTGEEALVSADGTFEERTSSPTIADDNEEITNNENVEYKL